MMLEDQIFKNMNERSTEELLGIWEENDQDQWSDKALEIVKMLLIQRGIRPALQQEKKVDVQRAPAHLIINPIYIKLAGIGIPVLIGIIAIISLMDSWIIKLIVLILFIIAVLFWHLSTTKQRH